MGQKTERDLGRRVAAENPGLGQRAAGEMMRGGVMPSRLREIPEDAREMMKEAVQEIIEEGGKPDLFPGC